MKPSTKKSTYKQILFSANLFIFMIDKKDSRQYIYCILILVISTNQLYLTWYPHFKLLPEKVKLTVSLLLVSSDVLTT